MQKRLARQASWKELLAAPEPLSHIVQIYDSDDFLVSGVTVFAAEGLRRDEAVVLTGTDAHLRAITEKLGTQGIDVHAALANGALRLFDAGAAAEAVLVGGMPDLERYQAAVAPAMADARRRLSGLRWWGEISNVLHQQGNVAAALMAEDLGDALAKKHGAIVLCSFLCESVRSGRIRGLAQGSLLQALPFHSGRGLRAPPSRGEPRDRGGRRGNQGPAAAVASFVEGPDLRAAFLAGDPLLDPRHAARALPRRPVAGKSLSTAGISRS